MTSIKKYSHLHSALFLLASFTFFFAFLVPKENLDLLILCSFICVITLSPLYFCDERNVIFSPFTLIFIFVFFSSIGKLLFLLFSTNQEKLYSFLQLDNNLYALYSGIFILCLFAVSYSSSILFFYNSILKSTRSCLNLISNKSTSTNKSNRILIICLFSVFFISVLLLIVFVHINNINLLSDPISAKRFLNIEGGVGNRINNHSYWLYKLVFMVKISFYMAILLFLNNRSATNLSIVFLIYCYLIFLSTFFSNRSELLIATVELSIIFFTLNKKQVYALVVFMATTLMIYLTISILRQGASSSVDPLNHLLGLRYLSGIDKLGIMHDYYLQSQAVQPGKSLVGLIGLISPSYSEGVYTYFNLFRETTMTEVYAVSAGGVPPGAIIEIFANFKYFGVVFVGALFGVLASFLHCLLLNTKNNLILLITFAVIIRFCFLSINTNFIIAFIRIIIDIGPFILTLIIVQLFNIYLQNIKYKKI